MKSLVPGPSGNTNIVYSRSLVTYIEIFPSKVEVWSLSDGKKGSRVRLCFRVVDDVPEKKGMDLWKQMSLSKCSFTCICRIFSPLNPSTTTVFTGSAFYPSLRFTLSLQSAVLSPHFTLTGQKSSVSESFKDGDCFCLEFHDFSLDFTGAFCLSLRSFPPRDRQTKNL